MNRKATLLPEEVFKIILAAICIGFLIFLFVSLYFAATGGQNKKLAEASLRKLANETVRVNEGGTFDSQGILIPNPTGWYIFGFVGGNLKPNLCTGQNCFCICENVALNPFNWRDKAQLKKCDNVGSCAIVSNLKSFGKIKIESGGIALFVRKVGGEIEITKK
jgi:hypothetical protein